ncbi:MAG TPA: hypothetical protein VHO47_04075 [Candidatus Babeliales bacterium]|nr:hypothetical protein [Candidatus Babeliales bacterium]
MNKMKIIICLFLYSFELALHADFQDLQKLAYKQAISRQPSTSRPAALGSNITEKFDEKELLNTVWQKDNPTTVDNYFRAYRERLPLKANPTESFVRAIHANNQTVTKFVHGFLDKRTEKIFDEIQQKDFSNKFNAPGELYNAVSNEVQLNREGFSKNPGIVYSPWIIKTQFFKPLREKLQEIVSSDETLKKMKIYVKFHWFDPNWKRGPAYYWPAEDGILLVCSPAVAFYTRAQQENMIMHELGHAKLAHESQHFWIDEEKVHNLLLARHYEYQADQYFASENIKNAATCEVALSRTQRETFLPTCFATAFLGAFFARDYMALSDKNEKYNSLKVASLTGLIGIPLIYKWMQFWVKKDVENEEIENKSRDRMTRAQYAQKFPEFPDMNNPKHDQFANIPEHAMTPYKYDNARRISEFLKVEAKIFGAQSKLEELD